MSQSTYMYDGPCDKSISFYDSESIIAEENYFKQENNKFKCRILNYNCKTKFLNSTILIDDKECFSEISGKFYVCIDNCNNITQIYDSNKLVYTIPLISNLLIEKEECLKIIEEMKNKLCLLKKKEYYLHNINSSIESLIKIFKENEEESYVSDINLSIEPFIKIYKELTENILNINENIKKNQNRIEQIEKELPNIYIDFIKSII